MTLPLLNHVGTGEQASGMRFSTLLYSIECFINSNKNSLKRNKLVYISDSRVNLGQACDSGPTPIQYFVSFNCLIFFYFVYVLFIFTSQWFSNLVTQEFWDELWLKECFANVLAFLAMDHVYPDWHMVTLRLLVDI